MVWQITMKSPKPFAAVLVLLAVLALTAGSALAKNAPKKYAHLDPSFGKSGVTKVATSGGEERVQMALGPEGREYLLQGTVLVALKQNGKAATGFGENGSEVIRADKGLEGHVTGLAVDSQGRVLVGGWLRGTGAEEGFVIRLLANGERDATFGTGGEVDSTFGVPVAANRTGQQLSLGPSVSVSSIAVNAEEQPIVGGSYLANAAYCSGSIPNEASFVARLTTTGALDTTFGRGGYAATTSEEVKSLVAKPGGGIALQTGRYEVCTARPEVARANFEALGPNGEEDPGLDASRPSFYMANPLAIDGKERAFVVQWHPLSAEGTGNVLDRLLPSGALDTSFGNGGGFPLSGRLGPVGALAVDARNRPLVAAGGSGVELMRLTNAGKVDHRFGPKGVVKGGARGNQKGGATAMAIDSKGRIYVASWVKSPALSTGYGMQIARFLPGS
jgi:uncharacterized delta-60 repeat protein